MSPWIYLPLHNRWPNRNCPSKLLSRHCPTRHLLCRSPLPLRPLHRSCIRPIRRVHPLIPPHKWRHPPYPMKKSPFRFNIYWRQHHLLPPTLPRTKRDASPILGLPRRLHKMKRCLLPWINNFIRSPTFIHLYPMRKPSCTTKGNLLFPPTYFTRMARYPSP